MEIRNGRNKRELLISNVPESQTAYFLLFLLLTTFHARVARQSEFLNHFAWEVGLSGNRKKGNKNGVVVL